MAVSHDPPSLTKQQKMVMMVFDDNGKYTIKKISRMLDIDRAQVSKALKRLAESNLVVKNDLQDGYKSGPNDDHHEYRSTDSGLQFAKNLEGRDDYYSDMSVFLHKRRSRFGFFGFIFVFLGWYGYANPAAYAQMFGDTTASNKSAAVGGIVIAKPGVASLTIISIVVIGGGGSFTDEYFSDPYVDYHIYPAQLPAELHGTSLDIRGIYAIDDDSEIVEYSCDNEPVIRDMQYSFDCHTENSFGNKETVTTTILIKYPINRLNENATACVSQHYFLSEGIADEYPYLLKLSEISPSRLLEFKNNHIGLMDAYTEAKDYINAKKHATIVLKYFNTNDIQALSTLGNAMRDEDRKDVSGTHCAIAVHNMPFIVNTTWGKLALAEDHHVLGEYDITIDLSSQVIDAYRMQTDNKIHDISYVNALVIKANALYRQAQTDQILLEEVKRHYSLAHNITKSYDTWFGLGNIDRDKGNLAEAREKYQEAKKFAGADSKEIDDAIFTVS